MRPAAQPSRRRLVARGTWPAPRTSVGSPSSPASRVPSRRRSRPASRRPTRSCATIAKDTPIAAHGGALAWSVYDYLQRPLPARDPPQRHRRAATGGVVAAPVRRQPRTGHARPRRRALHPLSPRLRHLPLRRRRRAARRSSRGCPRRRWTRRGRRSGAGGSRSCGARATHVIDGFDHRPDPRGRGPVLDCDIPYVKTLCLVAAEPPAAGSLRACGRTTDLAIRATTIVQVTDIDQGGGRLGERRAPAARGRRRGGCGSPARGAARAATARSRRPTCRRRRCS